MSAWNCCWTARCSGSRRPRWQRKTATPHPNSDAVLSLVRFAQLQTPAPASHLDQLTAPVSDGAMNVMRVEATEHADLEVGAELAIAGAGVDLAIEAGWQRHGHASIARRERHVGRTREGLHLDVDLTVAGAGGDRPARRQYVDAPVAGRGLYRSRRALDVQLAVAR